MAVISTPWRSFQDAQNFRQTYLRMLPLLHFNYSEINPVAVKSLMRAVGLPVGALRKPLRGLEADALAKGLRIIQALGLDERYDYKVQDRVALAA